MWLKVRCRPQGECWGGREAGDVGLGNSFAVLVAKNGTTWAWGYNAGAGQLGDNTMVSRSFPVQVVGNHSFVQVSCGVSHSLAVKADGSVWP